MQRAITTWALAAALLWLPGPAEAEDAACACEQECSQADHRGPHAFHHVMHPRGRLGAQIQPLTPQLRAYFRVPGEGGVLVAAVEPDSPAGEAGLRAGDVILRAGGEAVDGPRQLIGVVSGWPDDEMLPLLLLRDGQEREAEARLRAAEETAGPVPQDLIAPWGVPALEELRHQLHRLEQRLEELEDQLRKRTNAS